MHKQARSGLATVKRDFSITSTHSDGSSEIEWPPTQAYANSTLTKTSTTQTTTTTTTPAGSNGIHNQRSQRLKDILAGLAGTGDASQPPKPKGQALVDSKGLNKRPSLGSEQSTTEEPAAKKKRELPPSWSNDPLSASTFKRTSSTTSTTSIYFSEKTRSRSSSIKPPSSATPSDSTASSSSTPAKKDKVAAVFLSQEQTQILKLVQEGTSVFYTGSAGTGKSVLLREIIKALKKKYIKSSDAVAITASTGIAACNIGGVTIHSFAGIGLGVESAEELANKIRKNKKAAGRWLRTKVLIIDEVSMVDGDLFDKLAEIGSRLRKDSKPFGGIQIIVTGDFFQLPPVQKTDNAKFAFEADTWSKAVQRTFNLTKVFRQRDQEFVNMLNEMRFGKLSSRSIARFKSLARPITYDDGLSATELFPRREDVDRSNQGRLRQLDTHSESYAALDGGSIRDETQRQKMLANFMAPQALTLRLDAQVMLIKNVDETLVNGTIGRIARFVDPAVYGTELDENPAVSEFGGVIGTASAVASVGSATSKKAQKAGTTGTAKRYPVVEFALANGGRRYFLVMPEVWKVELPDGEVQVSRTQLPLILSWAMSIHKSQGQTLDRVKVDLGKVFEKGQAYVALSRATSLEGLQVLNFDPRKVMAHPKVIEWSRTLETFVESDD